MTDLPCPATLAATALIDGDHPFHKAGNRHMAYVNLRGTFDDMPLAQIVADFQTVYSSWMAEKAAVKDANFEQDVAKETR